MIPRRIERTFRWVVFIIGSIILFFLPLPQWRGPLWIFWGIITLQAWGAKRIPAVLFHSISDHGDWIGDPSIVMPLHSFEAQVKWLARLGYRGLFLDELYQIRRHKRGGGRAVAITMDDGYLDNWVGAFHILESYGLKATIFVATDWLDHKARPRPRLPHSPLSRAAWEGYMGSGELKALQKSGLIDIQSHGMSHDTIFTSDEIVGFVSPGNQPAAIYCYIHPVHKPTWFTQEMTTILGLPIFKTGEALAAPAFIPDAALLFTVQNNAAQPGFFDQPDWEEKLRQTVAAYKNKHGGLGQFETIPEARNRWQTEIMESRRRIEAITGKSVQHLAWPRNAYTPEAEQIALSCGYLSTTTVKGLHNNHHQPHRVERVAVTSAGRPFLDVLRLLAEIWVFKGYYIFWPLLFGLQRLSKNHVSKKKKFL